MLETASLNKMERRIDTTPSKPKESQTDREIIMDIFRYVGERASELESADKIQSLLALQSKLVGIAGGRFSITMDSENV